MQRNNFIAIKGEGDWERNVLKNPKPVIIVVFDASWYFKIDNRTGSFKVILDKIKPYLDQAQWILAYVNIDVEGNEVLQEKLDIDQIPTYLEFRKGSETKRFFELSDLLKQIAKFT